MKRSHWLQVTVLVVLVALVAACSGESASTTTESEPGTTASTGLLAELQESGSIRVGIGNAVPFGYIDEETGDLTGSAPEVARVVLDELGITDMEGVVVEFGALVGGLQAGNFDMIAAGMFVTPERAEQILFSDPDYCSTESLLVPEGNPDGLTDLASVAGTDVRLAVASGTVNIDYAAWAGIPDEQLVEFAGGEDMYDAIAAGRVDAVSDTILIIQQRAESMEGFEALPGFAALDENGEQILSCGAFGFLDQELRDEFNAIFNRLQDEGIVQDIIEEQTGLRDIAEFAADLTLEDLIS